MSHSKPPYRVVITGYGAVTPLGDSAAESWQAIMDYRRGYRYVDLSANGIHTHFIGQVENEPSLKGFPPPFVGVCRVTLAWRWPPRGRRWRWPLLVNHPPILMTR